MAAAVAAAGPLVAAGPPGWVVLGVLTIITVGVGIAVLAEKADDAAGEEDTDVTQDCPPGDEPAERVEAPKKYPEDPDSL